ncbi:2-oxoacid:ferredoxin oxidoreductase subunit beta [Pseudemcibacter aquimaris]|uniref:2-oxoacid:ferredoxin oxidoreductase subunit beta n=1 Tax=Pseudemcibacter aquimaris TaxID=2857064 RepID=UPI0020112AFF|nr:2-oxoacid:ferredoxin oxidoreductase subunit beta [Pseudemcibacter aquimaris]MCC3860083.1 2-oxoacid:ferredoxin oxidoreductase subunit beta [Pseudemcibacter aquimaris]WDU57412.1 2-oxoacid:ferredoxin oxidoreductase subunit beta [Pseudemcibacter aquimaris]
MNKQADVKKLTFKDFETDQEVRWCPGCGDYAILKGVQMTLANIGATPENTVFISGIGCSSRFPYYMETYGFHTIHGRAPAVATGVKLANPDLDVWLVTGDGDGLSIGGNHMLHVLRRNVDMQIMLFNNEIYGLTKGQYSPTSKPGTKSPSTPMGSVDLPLTPCSFALGAGARFVARGIDTALKALPGTLERARDHKGASFVEIYQNCIVFNDKVFEHFTNKKEAENTQIHVEHGKPLIFGKEKNMGIRFNMDQFAMEVVTIGENGITEDDILIHDETNKMMAHMLVQLTAPEFPVVCGVIYCEPAETYNDAVHQQMDAAKAAKPADFNALIRQGRTWTVE